MKFLVYFVICLFGVCSARQATVTDYVDFDIQLGQSPVQHVRIGLFGKIVPKTVDNFMKLANGLKVGTFISD